MNKTRLFLFWFLLLITISFVNVDADWTINTNYNFECGNETYTMNGTALTFSNYIHSADYMVFNSSGFNISSSNPITIYIDHINTSITSASDDDMVLEFCADTTAGSVTFTINGFRANYNYTVKRNSTTIANVTSNASGELTFTNNIWSKKSFEIYQGVTSAQTTTQTGTNIDSVPWPVTITLLDFDGNPALSQLIKIYSYDILIKTIDTNIVGIAEFELKPGTYIIESTLNNSIIYENITIIANRVNSFSFSFKKPIERENDFTLEISLGAIVIMFIILVILLAVYKRGPE